MISESGPTVGAWPPPPQMVVHELAARIVEARIAIDVDPHSAVVIAHGCQAAGVPQLDDTVPLRGELLPVVVVASGQSHARSLPPAVAGVDQTFIGACACYGLRNSPVVLDGA